MTRREVIIAAKAVAQALPQHRRELLAKAFNEANRQAREHSTY